MVQDHVPEVVATIIVELRVDIIVSRLLMFKKVGNILFVLLVFMDAALENVLHVMDVAPM